MSTDDPASRMWGDAMTAHFDRREHLGEQDKRTKDSLTRITAAREEVIDPVNQFDVDVNTVVAEASELLIRKHHDYGPKNISLSPGGALNGLRVRLFDKTARLNNLVDKDVDPKNESLRDTLIDIANYAVIGIMVLDGRWPE